METSLLAIIISIIALGLSAYSLYLQHQANTRERIKFEQSKAETLSCRITLLSKLEGSKFLQNLDVAVFNIFIVNTCEKVLTLRSYHVQIFDGNNKIDELKTSFIGQRKNNVLMPTLELHEHKTIPLSGRSIEELKRIKFKLEVKITNGKQFSSKLYSLPLSCFNS